MKVKKERALEVPSQYDTQPQAYFWFLTSGPVLELGINFMRNRDKLPRLC